jgi:hypothetical protein
LTIRSTDGERAINRPSDGALWTSIAETLQRVVLPALGDDPHTRQVAIQLVGLATYGGRRGPDPTPARVDEVADVLGSTVGAERTPVAVMQAAADLLVAAVDADSGQADQLDVATLAVRDDLRSVLLRHLDEDLATEDVLLGAFRGRLPDG